MPLVPSDLPRYHQLMLPVLRAVNDLGGSASGREIVDRVVEAGNFTEEQVSLSYANREKSVLLHRIDFARSYCKVGGALESPARKLFLLTPLGSEILALPESEALARIADLDRLVRGSSQRRPPKTAVSTAGSNSIEVAMDTVIDGVMTDDDDGEDSWQEAALGRLHRLTPEAFEEFVLYVLRLFGMQLTRRGGTGDEGIDGIGIAPLSEVLSATVAVQVKRYDPTRTVGREPVALFQRDASAVGAERAIMVTLGRFTAGARKAATTATPHIDLIDGERLCELLLTKEVGVRLQPVVDLRWFDRFDQE